MFASGFSPDLNRLVISIGGKDSNKTPYIRLMIGTFNPNLVASLYAAAVVSIPSAMLDIAAFTSVKERPEATSRPTK